MEEIKNSNSLEIIELSVAFKNVCEGITQFKSSTNPFGQAPSNFQTVSLNLLKLINMKCSLLVTECCGIKPLADSPILRG